MDNNQIMMIHGTDYTEMTKTLLEQADLASEIGRRDARIALKPNLVAPAKASNGSVTHPEIVAGVLEYLQKKGFQNICVMEGSWVGARTMPAVKLSGIYDVCQKYRVPFYDLQADSGYSVKSHGMQIEFCKRVSQIDFWINLPVLKGHCQTVMTCALKNHKGLITNAEKRRFHTLGLHKPIAHLAAAAPRSFIVVDNICGDLDFEEGGNPVTMNRIFCCKDPVLCDAFACKVMGVDISDVPYIGMAERLGVGTTDVDSAKIIMLNEGTSTPNAPMSRRVAELASYTMAKDACSACYGTLIHALDKLDRQNMLWGHRQKICIGQGYRGQGGKLGVGSCTRGFECSLKGCPPTAEQMLEFLEENWRE